jgi:inosine-uridine nucleoside N-ribohydrolase
MTSLDWNPEEIGFPKIDDSEMIKKLSLPSDRLDVVIDTDTYNEVDDQFALAYALNSPDRLHLEALYAAPFLNSRSVSPADGMEKSFNEIIKLLGKTKHDSRDFVFKGSDRFLRDTKDPVTSPAALDLIRRARDMADGRLLYVVSIGAITDVASAILLQPDIIDKIVVVWLGGHPVYWPDTKEFNLMEDMLSARVVLDCGVPLIRIPCMGVASHLLTSLPELERYLMGKNDLCDMLVQNFREYRKDHFGWAKEIWDIATIGYLMNSDWTVSVLDHSPVLTEQCTWSIDQTRHLVRTVMSLSRNQIFADMFRKISLP